jgi:hypothetical protein
MSLASDLLEKMRRKGQLRIKPELLPAEKPVEPSMDQGVEQEKKDQPETHGPAGPLFSKTERKMAPVKIFSKLFNEEIWLVADQEEMEVLVSKGVKEAIYMAWEIPILSGKDRESLKAVHATKKVFPGSALT